MGWMADRLRRVPIIGWASSIFAGMVFLSGIAVNAFMFFWARFGVGIAKASTIPVHSSVIADTYPIGIRGRLGSLNGIINNGLTIYKAIICIIIQSSKTKACCRPKVAISSNNRVNL